MNGILSCILAISMSLGAYVAQAPKSAVEKKSMTEQAIGDDREITMQIQSDGGEAIYVGDAYNSDKPDFPCPTDRRPEDYAEFYEGSSMPLAQCENDFDLLNTYDPSTYGSTETIIPATKGTEVYAVQNGTVIRAEFCGAYGYMVKIDHGNGIYTIYAHLSEIIAKHGEQITAGQLIGKVGITGHTSCYALGYTFEEK